MSDTSKYEEHYNRGMDELSKRELSVSESRDRAILFTSMPILAMALAYCKFIISGDPINYIWILGVFAGSFFLAIICVMVSYLTSTKAKRDMEKKIKRYLENKAKGERPISGYNKATSILNFASVVLYLGGIILMAVFFGFNFPKGEFVMTDEERGNIEEPIRDTNENQNPEGRESDIIEVRQGIDMDIPDIFKDEPDDEDKDESTEPEDRE